MSQKRKEDLRAAFRESYGSLLSPLTVHIWLIAVMVAILAAPFGTDRTMSFEGRALYWLVIVTVSIVAGCGVRATVKGLVGTERSILFDVSAVLMMTAVFSPVPWLAKRGLALSGAEPDTPFLHTALNVLIISVGVFVARRLTPGVEPGSYFTSGTSDACMRVSPRADAHGPESARLLRRLPREDRAPILYLCARDHFVEVVTEGGRHTLRMRLGDAMDEMEPVEGFCTHRSFWVARRAIAGMERENAHRFFVIVTNGDRLPISRKYRPDLEASGIIHTGENALARSA